MKVVVDVNVWISALLWGGVPREILKLAQNKQIIIFAADDLYQELSATLQRNKFEDKIQSLGLTRADILEAAREVMVFCPTLTINIPELRDAKDNHILATALSAQAEVVITGDMDLLTLHNFAGISIMNPTDFINMYF